MEQEQQQSSQKKEKMVRRTSIGGQALIEGVMMRGASAMSIAVRDPNGEIVAETKRLKTKKRWYQKVPVVRGVVAFFDSMVTGVRTLLKSANVAMPDEETPSKFWMGFAVFLGLAFGIGLFFVLPWGINYLILDRFLPSQPLVSALVEGGIRIVIFVSYLFFVSLLKDIRRTFQYHGAEHRTISCFEKGLPMTVKNVQTCSTRHNRCGTTFLFFVMVISILVFSLVTWLLSFTNLQEVIDNAFLFKLTLLGIRLACLPLVAGLSYELLRFLAAMPDNWFVAIFRAPGLALQRLTTYIPEDEMAEVALKAFTEVYNMDADPTLCELEFGQIRIADARDKIQNALGEQSLDPAEVDWMLCDVTGLERSGLRDVKILTVAQAKKLNEILTRRRTGEPLWYILGYTDFYGYRIMVNHNVLIPRFATETLAEKAIAEIKGRTDKTEVLDLCTGSGCIALAIAKNTSASVTASDISEPALTVAANNLEGTDTELVFSDLFDNLKGRSFDVIVSNPPYIRSKDIEELAVEVQNYEPLSALDGGADGLEFYKKIVSLAPQHLKKGGALLVEIGFDQSDAVVALMQKSFRNVEIFCDLDGVKRVVKGYQK